MILLEHSLHLPHISVIFIDVTHVVKILHNVVTFFLRKYYSSYKIKEGVMGEKCNIYGGKEKCMESFSGET